MDRRLEHSRSSQNILELPKTFQKSKNAPRSTLCRTNPIQHQLSSPRLLNSAFIQSPLRHHQVALHLTRNVFSFCSKLFCFSMDSFKIALDQSQFRSFSYKSLCCNNSSPQNILFYFQCRQFSLTSFFQYYPGVIYFARQLRGSLQVPFFDLMLIISSSIALFFKILMGILKLPCLGCMLRKEKIIFMRL